MVEPVRQLPLSRIPAIIAVIISAKGNVNHTSHALDKSGVISCDNAHATGRINTSCLNSEMTSEDNPLPSAWNTPCSDRLIPAKKKPAEIILVALTHRACVPPDKPNAAQSGSAMISKSNVPDSIITDV